jgi:hypothetical protein
MTPRVPLHIATATDAPETTAQRVRRLQAEIKALARDHVKALTDAMLDVEQIAAEIADGGDAYAPGARDIARRLADDLQGRVATLNAITGRTS